MKKRADLEQIEKYVTLTLYNILSKIHQNKIKRKRLISIKSKMAAIFDIEASSP